MMTHRIVCRCLVLQDGHQRHRQHDQQSYLRHRLHQPPKPRSASELIGNLQSSSCFAQHELAGSPLQASDSTSSVKGKLPHLKRVQLPQLLPNGSGLCSPGVLCLPPAHQALRPFPGKLHTT